MSRAQSPKPFHQSSSPLSLTIVLLGHHRHLVWFSFVTTATHFGSHCSPTSLRDWDSSLQHCHHRLPSATVTHFGSYCSPLSLAPVLQGLFLFYLTNNSLGCRIVVFYFC